VNVIRAHSTLSQQSSGGPEACAFGGGNAGGNQRRFIGKSRRRLDVAPSQKAVDLKCQGIKTSVLEARKQHALCLARLELQ